jgi:DNA-binding CsgD family transcriptional regulator/tetratricopeptide (TPR) repeat protein
VSGELGIGKSLLLAEARTAATEMGFSVAAAAANEVERMMPLSPLLAAVGESKEALATLAHPSEPGDVGLRLIGRVQTRLEERASAGPALVCLDDIDHADPVTLLALRILTQHLASYPLVWLLARSAEGGGDAKRLFDLLEGEGAVRIELRPLTDATVAALMTDALGAEPDAGLLTLAAGADGNPFVLAELLDGLREEGTVRISAGTATLASEHAPGRYQQLMHDRVVNLGPQTRQLLEVGAVLGPCFALEDAAEMLGLPPAALVPAVEEAFAAGIVVANSEGIAFRQALLWHAVADTIPTPVLRALHRQVGEILLDRGGSAMPAAVHLLSGARPGDKRLLDGLGRAAREVLGSSPQTAADLAMRALDLTDPSDRDRDERLLTSVETLTAARRLPEASTLITAALARSAPVVLRARLRGAMSSILRMSARPEEARTEAEAVLAMSYLPGWLRDEAEVALLQALSDLPDTRSAAEQSMAILAAPEGQGDVVILAALAVRAAISWDEGRLTEGLELSRQAVARVKSDPLDARSFQPYLDLASRLVDIREFGEAAAMLAIADSGGGGHTGREAGPAYLRARRDLATGRLDDAVAEAQAVLGVSALLGPSPYPALAESVLTVVALRRGALQAAENHLQEAVGYATVDNPLRVRKRLAIVAAQLAEARSGPHAALELSVGVYDEISRDRWLLTGEPAIVPWLVRTALAADDRARAVAVAAAADEIARGNKALRTVTAVAAHARGLLSHDAGLLRQAAEQHEDLWLRATATEDLGALLVRAGRLPEAIERFDQSLTGYERTGATRDAARIRRRLRQLGVRRRHWTTADRPIQGWESLTDTERSISELVSQGLTNRQVAEQMFISAHTVAFHLRQVFRKLSIGSRVELARLTVEHDRGSVQELDIQKPSPHRSMSHTRSITQSGDADQPNSDEARADTSAAGGAARGDDSVASLCAVRAGPIELCAVRAEPIDRP